MQVMTSRLGEIEVNEQDIYHFPIGIPGFEENRRFTLINIDDTPFAYMQSIDNGDLAFIVTDPFLFYPSYEFELPAEEKEILAIQRPEQVSIRSIVTTNDNFALSTLNLLAPVVLNIEGRCGRQVVLHQSNYKTKHRLFQQPPEGKE